jgi:adenylosuccinate lyase
MTSRDVTENVELLQVRRSLELLRDRAVAALARLAELAIAHRETVMAGRSHNVPGQATTLGKRFATIADELLVAVGAGRGAARAAAAARHQGPGRHRRRTCSTCSTATPTGSRAGVRGRRAPRLHPRAHQRRPDLSRARSTTTWSSSLVQLVSAPSNLATTIRLMAGNELVTEGFQPGRSGRRRCRTR